MGLNGSTWPLGTLESLLGEPGLTSQAAYSPPNWKIGGGPLNGCESLLGLTDQAALITDILGHISGGGE